MRNLGLHTIRSFKKSPKMYVLLEQLSDSEWNQLIKYSLLLHDKNTDINKLILFLFNNKLTLPSVESIKEELFPSSTTKNVSNKLHILKLILDDYLSWIQYQKEEDLKKYCLLNAYQNRGFYSEYLKLRRKFLVKLYNKASHDINSSYYIHRILHSTMYSNKSEFSLSADSILTESLRALNNYTISWTKVYEALRARRKSNRLQDKKMVVLPERTKSNLLEESIHNFVEMLSKNNIESFTNLYEYFLQFTSKEASEVIKIYHQLLIVHCIEHVIEDTRYIQPLIQLYEIGLKDGLFIYDGYFSDLDFALMISTGCSLQKIDWAEKIFSEYINFLEPTVRENQYHLSMSVLELYRKRFNESLEHIELAGSSGKINRLEYRWIKLIILMTLRRKDFDSFHHAVQVYFNDKRRHTKEINIRSTKILLSITYKIYYRHDKESILEILRSKGRFPKKNWFNQNINMLLDY